MLRSDYNGNHNIIYARLKQLRQQAHLSQEKVVAQMQLRNVNMNQQMYSLLENNKRFASDYEVACLCDIFQVSPEELLGDFEKLGTIDE